MAKRNDKTSWKTKQMSFKKKYKFLVPEKTRLDIRIFLNKLIYPIYLGNQFYCNVCNKSFRKFLPKGNVPRENAQCPYCGSLERTRLLTFYLKNETKIFEKKNHKILHFAPEKPLFKILKKTGAEYIDGDINPAYARNIIDITNIQFPQDYFDYIICSHVLGHVKDEIRAIKELRRVIKTSGEIFILTLLNSNSEKTYENPAIISEDERLEAYGESDLCRLHGALDFEKKLQKNGFLVERIDYRKNFSPEINEKFRLGNGQREIIFKCTK